MSPDGWNRCTIGDIFTVARGGSPRPIDAYLTDDPAGINWIKIGDATASGKFIRATKERIKPEGLSKTRKVIPGDFILSNSMSFGRPYIMAIDGCIHDGWLLLRPNDEDIIDREFYYYLLGSDILQQLFSTQAAGSAVRNLNIDLVAAVEVQVPPLHEQRRIAEILSSVDEAIAATRTVIEQTIKVKQGVLERLLTKGIGHTRFKQTEIGEIPEGWEVKPVDELCVLSNGNGFRPPDWSDKGLPIIRIQNLNGSKNFNYFDGTPLDKWLINPGDLLFAWAGVRGVSFGPTIWPGPLGVLNQHIFKISCREDVDKRWLFQTLKLITFKIEAKAHGFKDSLLHVHKKEITGQLVAVPPFLEQMEISNNAAELQVAEDLNQASLDRLLSLKSALMSDLLTGRKRVTDALPLAAE